MISTKKNLLLITYYWPPLGGPGSIRPVKFAKYLPDFDYCPIIVTRKDIAYHSYDNLLINDVIRTNVIKTETLDPARLLWLCGMRNYRPQRWQRPIKKSFNFPDHKLFWIPFAYQAGLLRKHDYIMATAPPFSSFIIGYMISLRSGKPLILDFRDAWAEFPFLPYHGIQKTIAGYLERKLTKYASLIVVVDDNIKRVLIKKYPGLKDRVHVIPNGYDPCDFTVPQYPPKFTLSYLGTVRSERDPATILHAVNDLIATKKIGNNDINIKFIGHVETRYINMIKKYPFTHIYGHQPHVSALHEFSSAHAAFLITTGSEFFYPSRQNEYLASGLPIIVIGRSKGIHLLADAFNKGYPGWIYDFADIDGIKNKILELLQAWKNKKIIHGKTPFSDLTRKNLTYKLKNLIGSI